MSRYKIVATWCTPEQREEIKMWAKKDSRTVSAFIKVSVDEKIKRMKGENQT